MNAIEIQGLKKTFTGKRMKRVEALKGIDLVVAKGEVFGFLGPNGAGKSTTIKTVMGLIRPTAGTVQLNGVDAQDTVARRTVGYLPENPAFYDYLSAQEYLAFVGSVFKMPAQRLVERSEQVLHRLDLWEARSRSIRGYSKGMVQRLGLAQALLHDPEICILDEPMSGLDPLGRALVKELIRELKGQGKCVFFSTHITADVEAVCDRLAVIVKGVVRRVQRVDEIMTGAVAGYRLRVGTTEGEHEERVELNSLREALSRLEQEGCTVTLVEPIRNDLERFFLDIVKESDADAP
jgi:ABC-2 type transport system ATP-binding protein